ncbi:hypothetical protein [Pontibacter rugosus]|uniref:Uncharacterized protein n=1 Tax=Pontibacter rugosus TaxID=1745966 RepID=A0ABW3SMG2_9BACT
MDKHYRYKHYYDGQEHKHRIGYGQDYRSRDMQQGFGRDYRKHPSRDYRDDKGKYNRPYQYDYRQRGNNSNRGYTNNSWRTEDRFSGSQASTSDIRQGYGISSYDGTSDR